MSRFISHHVSGRAVGKSFAAAAVAVALLAACGNSSPKVGGTLGTNPASTTKAAGGSTTTAAGGGGGGGGTAAFCAAFNGVSDIKTTSAADWPAAVAKLKQFAKDIRANAPAEIAAPAKAYADLFDAIAAAGSDPSGYTAKYADYFSKHTDEITKMAVWVGTNSHS